VIRQSAKDISRQGRDTTGVKVMNLGSDASLSALAVVTPESDEGTE
jgi:DNA gyrase/topoisomerase IV subunit A